jgi:hypothetical protein
MMRAMIYLHLLKTKLLVFNMSNLRKEPRSLKRMTVFILNWKVLEEIFDFYFFIHLYSLLHSRTKI